MFKFVKNSNGFTLIEVIASIALFTILTTGSLYIFQTAFFQTNQTQVKTSALNVARNTLMFMENQNFIEMRELFYNINKNDAVEIKFCSSNYAIVKNALYQKDCTDTNSYQPFIVDGINFEVKVYGQDEIYVDKKVQDKLDFYSFYVPIRIVVSWELKGNHFVELKGDIKSEDLR